ncbi:hypothetical protein CYMTET_57021 [Cymbomonas tetramitiformis]|uniref:1,3-beta-glucan synthase component FKS1-like domain-containing protein n=1 Tax=Cymbomonas tetramitiformis TaxID=36881 RepID=A0AAE0EN53_9CHLO|nr:hypothetical protein CYMTET_57021 [Cymbomonas tetramitiformis]
MDTDAYWDDSPSKGVGSGASPTPRAASRASGLMTQDNPLLDETVSTLKAGTKDDLMSLTMQPGPSTPVAASPTGVRTPQSPTTGKWLHWSDLSLLGRKEAIHELLIPIATFLGQVFGFQQYQEETDVDGQPCKIASSLENQVEHVAHILANMLPLCREKNKSNEAPDVIFRKTVATLHKKMLQNYFKWARFLNLQESMNHLEWAIIAANLGHDPEALTQLSIAHSPERVLSLQLRQLMLFFLIWGEAANLRHCPECLMFIFHCCLDELVTGEQLCQPFNPAAREDFLDAIVTPFYNFLHAETQKTVKAEPYASAAEGITYDDFNECFWDTFVVLTLICPTSTARGSVEGEQKHSHYFYLRGTLLKVEADLEEQAEKKLEKKSRLDLIFHKTYREQRSWAHVFFNFRRVYILHAILFQVLVLSAFKGWSWEYMGTGVLTHLAMEILHDITALALGPLNVNIPKLETWESFLKRAGGKWAWFFTKAVVMAVLVHFYVSSLDKFKLISAVYSAFWLCSYLFNRNGYVLKLAICSSFPFFHWEMRTYTTSGKEMAVPWDVFWQYAMFWVVVFTLKILFAYFLVIKPLVEPTDQLWDRRFLNTGDSKWHPDGDLLLILLRWAAPTLMFFADTGVFYILLSSACSAAYGVYLKLGCVSDWPELVHKFGDLPALFNKKCMPKEVQETPPPSTESMLSEDARNPATLRFALAWNEIIERLRTNDLLSNEEHDSMRYEIVDVGEDPAVKDFFEGLEYAVYPNLLSSPVFCASALESADISHYPSKAIIMAQAKDLTVFLLVQLRVVRFEDRNAVAGLLTA